MRKLPRRRPSLECLEDRRLLSTPGLTDPTQYPVGPVTGNPPALYPASPSPGSPPGYLTLANPLSNPWAN